MIVLRPMHKEEFSGYLDYFIPDYAQEIASNYRLSADASLVKAKQEIAADLPDGVNTAGQILLCLFTQQDNRDSHVGYLWYKPDTASRTAFIYDFHIFNACQGQGLGKQALQAFEQMLQDQDFEHIRLRVAGDNTRGRHVYEAMGFGVTSFNMSKTIAS